MERIEVFRIEAAFPFEHRELQIVNSARMTDADDGTHEIEQRNPHRVSEAPLELARISLKPACAYGEMRETGAARVRRTTRRVGGRATTRR